MGIIYPIEPGLWLERVAQNKNNKTIIQIPSCPCDWRLSNSPSEAIFSLHDKIVRGMYYQVPGMAGATVSYSML